MDNQIPADQGQPLTRAQRRQQERLARKQSDARGRTPRHASKFVFWLIVLAIVGLAIWGLVRVASRPLPGELIANLGNDHIDTIETAHTPYNSEPPTSGPHVGNIAAWGVHAEPVADALQIHNLEDGGVVIQYNCAKIPAPTESCNAWTEKLKAVVEKYEKDVLLAPRPTLDAGIALTAWTRLDKWTPVVSETGNIAFDENRLQTFIRAYRGIDHHVPGAG